MILPIFVAAACSRGGGSAAEGSTSTGHAAGTGSETADLSVEDTGVRSDLPPLPDLASARCTIASGPFESFTTASLGPLFPADVDGDDITDLVTGRGFVVTANLDVVAIAQIPTSTSARPGQLDGDGALDLAYVTSETGDIIVVPAIAAGGGAPIVTATATEPLRFLVRDYDEDGVDDLVLILPGGSIESWRAQGNGEFVRDQVLDVEPPLDVETSMQRHGYGVELVLGARAGQILEYDPGIGFVATDAFPSRGAVALEPIRARGDGDEQILRQDCWGSEWEVHSNIVLAEQQSGEWIEATYSLVDCSRDVGHGDVDGDVIPEIFVASYGSGYIDAVCIEGTDLLRCGAFDVDHGPDSLAVFGESPLLAYSTENDGGWVAALTAMCE